MLWLGSLCGVVRTWPLWHDVAMRARTLAAMVGCVGIVFLLRPCSAVMHPAVVLLIGAALANALYQLLTRKLLDEKVHTTLFYSASVGTAALTLGLPLTTNLTQLMAVGIVPLVLLCVLAGLGLLCLTHA